MTCGHPLAERLTAFALGELDAGESARVLEHIEACGECSREIDFLADITTAASRGTSGARVRGKLLGWRSWIVVAAAALLVVWVARRAPDRERDWSEFADRNVPIFVAAELRAPAPSLAEEFEHAMQGWQQRDFAVVDKELSAFIAVHPDHAPARFWRGVARRELGRFDDAMVDLRAAAEMSDYLREHALWTLANLWLVRGKPEQARAALDELARIEGEFAVRAEELGARVRSAN